ncbi:MAG: DUF1553 domain-containing protein [Planctomycetota bacterium]
MKRYPTTLLAAALALCACTVAAEEGPGSLFHDKVAPLLKKRCGKCHMEEKRKGGLSMNTRINLLQGGESGAALEPGKSSLSAITRRIRSTDPKKRMPPKGERLKKSEIDAISRWIDEGAPWLDGFTFNKSHRRAALAPREPELPAGKAQDNPIDLLLKPYFKKHGVNAERTISQAAFRRRTYLDLVGLLPPSGSPGADTTEAREATIDSLLGNRGRYTGHWLTFWNDILRNAYKGTGFIDGGRGQITEWLYRSLYENLPYDRFVHQLISPVPGSDGFIRGIKWRGVVNESQRPEIQAAQNVAQVFLGTNLKCASCHDSFVNHWKLKDSYAFASVFASGPLQLHRCDKPNGETSKMAFLYPELGEIDAKASRNERLKQLADLLVLPENGRLSRTIVNRLWAVAFGRGIVEPLDNMDMEPWSQDLLDWLASDLVKNGYNLKHTLKLITTSKAYRLPAIDEKREDDPKAGYVFRGPLVRRLSAEQFIDAAWSLAGSGNRDDIRPGKRDGRGQGGQYKIAVKIHSSAARKSAPGASKAEWIWSDRGYNTAPAGQVAYFRHAFNIDKLPPTTVLTATADNEFVLYLNGEKLLESSEWNTPVSVNPGRKLKRGKNLLAVRAANGGGVSGANPAGLIVSLKGMDEKGSPVFEEATSPAWLHTLETVKGWQLPETPDSKWKASFRIGSLDAEPWNVGGHFQSATPGAGAIEARSSLAFADQLQVALGRPNREQVVSRRESVATLLQALELTNGKTLDRIITWNSKQLLAQEHKSSARLIKAVYNRGLSREPSEAELDTLKALVGTPASAQGIEDLLWTILMHPEFQLNY